MDLLTPAQAATGAAALVAGAVLYRQLHRPSATSTSTQHADRWCPGAADLDAGSRALLAEAVRILDAAGSYADVLSLRAEATPDLVAHWQRKTTDDPWQKLTFAEFADLARRIAGSLVDGEVFPQAVVKGESIAIAGPTRSEWFQISMGAQYSGGVTVGVYPRQSRESLSYLLAHSEARVFFLDDPSDLQYTAAAKIAGDLPQLHSIVTWTDELASDAKSVAASKAAGLSLLPLSALTGHEPISPIDLASRRPQSIDDTAVLVYTSGTTGHPKGVMLTHGNILASCKSGIARASTDEGFSRTSISMNYLPLAHAFEQIINGAPRLAAGFTCAFNTSIASLLPELAEVQPTSMIGVPRMFEKMYVKIMGMKESLTGAKRKVFDWAEGIARAAARVRLANNGAHSSEPLPFPLRWQWAVADALVFQKIRMTFGGRVKMFGTGAAPIAPEILEFFWGIGMPIFEGWGMSEIPLPAVANRPGFVKLGTIGVPAQGATVRLGDDGEILVKHLSVFKGYFKNPEATAETFIDNAEGRWLRTGDIGQFDADGFLKIVDRKKHIIITAGGKNIAPAAIEKAIKSESPLISNLHVHGDRRPFVSALICPSPVETLELGQRLGVVTLQELDRHMKDLIANPIARSPELNALTGKVVAHPDFCKNVLAAVRRGNEKLVHVERVRRFCILNQDFSIEAGELTPTMKMKRREIEALHQISIDRLYSDPKFGIEAEAAGE